METMVSIAWRARTPPSYGNHGSQTRRWGLEDSPCPLVIRADHRRSRALINGWGWPNTACGPADGSKPLHRGAVGVGDRCSPRSYLAPHDRVRTVPHPRMDCQLYGRERVLRPVRPLDCQESSYK